MKQFVDYLVLRVGLSLELAGWIAEHIEPLMLQIEALEESLYSIQFEQHWLLAQTDRQEIGMRSTCILSLVS